MDDNPSAAGEYNVPESYMNVDDAHEMASLPSPGTTHHSQQHAADQHARAEAARRRRSSASQATSQEEYDAPASYMNVPEAVGLSPIQNRDDRRMYEDVSLEEERSRDQAYVQPRESIPEEEQEAPSAQPEPEPKPVPDAKSGGDEDVDGLDRTSRLATELFTISYLVLFAILGTLARLGLQALTLYPGTPVVFSVVWPNFAGSLVLGFLAEDRMLFRFEWGTPTYDRAVRQARKRQDLEASGSSTDAVAPAAVDLAAAKKAHVATKKTIPLYIGLATGFCGSFTSFSTFMRDMFLATSNDLPTPGLDPLPGRNGGYDFMALLAVTITMVSLSLSGLYLGAQLAILLEPITPSLPFRFTRRFLDRLAVFLGWGCWVGAILLAALPPDRYSHPGASETWRGRAVFALVFAPLGCLGRFYASLYLNVPRFAAFPLGTFTVNMLGTAVLGMAWDLAHVPYGGVIGCQVLQGIEDGFCGCLTTVSTWVAELSSLRRRHAYRYGAASVIGGYVLMLAIMGGLRWEHGFAALKCLH
ncbi:CrcB-like protein-domain-containing protein [Xylariomycetidae sp. FL0641]|nr:CrcB-like protein-domain-containing protein [Xylariomycetidae sp. FL0641]